VFLRRIGELTRRVAVVAIACAVALVGTIVAFAIIDVGSGSIAVWVAAALALTAAAAIAWRLRRAPLSALGAYDEPVAGAVLGGAAEHPVDLAPGARPRERRSLSGRRGMTDDLRAAPAVTARQPRAIHSALTVLEAVAELGPG
jgi:hypothetical protein